MVLAKRMTPYTTMFHCPQLENPNTDDHVTDEEDGHNEEIVKEEKPAKKTWGCTKKAMLMSPERG